MGNNPGAGGALTDTGKSIRKYGDIMAERQKIMAMILSNQLSAQQNWFYKQQEMNQQHKNRLTEKNTLDPLQQQQLEYQNKLMEQMDNQGQGQQSPMTQQTNVMTEQPRPQVRMGAKGAEVNYPNPKDWIFQRIQEKEAKGFQLSKQEQKYKDKYLGFKEKTIQDDIINQITERGLESLNANQLEIYNNVIKKRSTGGKEYDPDLTQKVSANIRTPEDYDEIIKNAKQYEKAGVDITEVISAQFNNPMVRNNPGLGKKLKDFFKTLLLGQ